MVKKFFMVCLLSMAISSVPSWALDLKPGKYEITIKTTMPGSNQQMPTQTMTQCMTGQDPVPNASTAAQGCTITDMKTRGNTITYTMECQQQGTKTVTTGEMTYKGDSFEGKTQTKLGPAAGGMVINSEIKGKRIGDCD